MHSCACWWRYAFRSLACLSILCLVHGWSEWSVTWTRLFSLRQSDVNWKACGDNFQCANIAVPLDYHNASDPRVVTIAVTRYLATNTTHRKGSVFINPGGPGGSGTSLAYRFGPRMAGVLQGLYDIVGFDPRAINLTRPYASCFESKLDEEIFALEVDSFHLNLPVNVTESVIVDLEAQVARAAAAVGALSNRCAQRTGDYMAYFGTEFVARDIDELSKIIEGEKERVNYWGFSYGTILGQYLIKILPPSRLGKIMIDGVADPDVWAGYPLRSYQGQYDDFDNVLFSFADSCVKSGDACALSSLSPRDIVLRIDETIESLYYKPQPVTDLAVPAVATAANLRKLIFDAMLKIQTWSDLAVELREVFIDNYTGLMHKTMVKIDPAGGSKPDYSSYSGNAIRCTDAKPYPSAEEFPTNYEIVQSILESMKTYSSRIGDQFSSWSFCHLWKGIDPRRSRYTGTFELEDGVLDTPILVLSNTYDPVTPLANAISTKARLGSNARLIQQVNGWGHCTIAQKSFCTADIVSRYMLDGEVPSANHTLCDVVERPFERFEKTLVVERELGDASVRMAWTRLSDEWVS
ncbi:hypothetical protein OE88DRAFT_1689184 [Heliocybe sulcata]|uniref:Peptidase S33 tripeptidyl aminopeptidase-like C-terminal domain-containing protein n=1 Tax=Heliocybe sulcata TaxID=5364 RepID=A0A5C3MLX7_9AGAM|nr:hypothetical protein OE88DRAFT_1689184 [Heliocybe sulcata]